MTIWQLFSCRSDGPRFSARWLQRSGGGGCPARGNSVTRDSILSHGNAMTRISSRARPKGHGAFLTFNFLERIFDTCRGKQDCRLTNKFGVGRPCGGIQRFHTNNCRGAPLRGRCTPAIPARLRSERARNSYKILTRAMARVTSLQYRAETRSVRSPRPRPPHLRREAPSVARGPGSAHAPARQG